MNRLCRTSKYVGKHVAVIKGNIVVAVSKSQFAVYKMAKKIYPKETLGIYYVPTAKEALTALCNILTRK
ncbi:hypothetical protein HZB07_01050 [Candidatus Saganbacteria bacterium]|nr:hypothetical protein [Candidatus Saganbacteria bacterium]